MAVLEVLSEVVGPEELLAAVALPELVIRREVLDPLVPVLVRRRVSAAARGRRPAATEIPTAVAARVGLAGPVRALVERLAVAREGLAGPAVPSHV